MSLDLIPASAYPLDVLADVYNRARTDYLVPMPMTPESLSAYNTRHSVDLSASLVVEQADRLIGLALLGLRGERAWITRMGVVPGARRDGVGRTLMDGVLRTAVSAGATQAQLEVIQENAIALRLFRDCGFAVARRLLVLERPAGFPAAVGPLPDRLLNTSEARAVIERAGAGYAPSWLEETPSLRRARRLAGIGLNDAALVYGDDNGLLTPVVLANADDVTGPALLAAFHTQWPEHPALKENVPEGDRQAEWFSIAGYRLSFTRLELRRAL
jgi:ribosomal protein S18 acetylase RimI-like enzyme